MPEGQLATVPILVQAYDLHPGSNENFALKRRVHAR